VGRARPADEIRGRPPDRGREHVDDLAVLVDRAIRIHLLPATITDISSTNQRSPETCRQGCDAVKCCNRYLHVSCRVGNFPVVTVLRMVAGGMSVDDIVGEHYYPLRPPA
jgi:hypothetical protein